MKKEQLILQGGGEHAKVVLDCLQAQATEVLALFDPKYHDELFGVKQMGKYDPDFASHAKCIVAIGDNALRKEVVGFTQHAFTYAIHPSCIVSRHAQIGEGSMILHGVIVQAHSTIGKHVILNTAVCIDHDCDVGNYVHIAPRAVLCGRVIVGEGALIGAGATLLPGIRIGAWAIVGAGAVVTRDVAPGKTVKGNPAREVGN